MHPKVFITQKNKVMNNQDAIMNLFSPLIDQIVERVADRVLSVTANKEPKFYSRQETADLLHITLPTLSRITNDGLITSRRVGTRILYDAEAIDAAVKQQVIFKYRRG